MTSYLNFLIEANLCLLLFLAFYGSLLKKETDFYFNRFYILASLSFSILFPLFNLEGITGGNLLSSVGDAIPTYWLPEFLLGSEEALQNQNTGPTIWKMVLWIYVAGVITSALLFIIRFKQIFYLIRKVESFKWKSCRVATTTKNLPTFSFFHFIHIGQVHKLSENEVKIILRHEHIHVKSLHTVDILFTNILEIIFWFNPLIKKYKKILTQLHEFEADARSVENHDLSVYCNLLARVALESADFSIANHFNKSLTIKRITMMQTLKSKIKIWKVAALTLAFPATFLIVACQDQVMEDVGKVVDASAMATEYPVEVQSALTDLKKANPESKFNVLEMDEAGLKDFEDLQLKSGAPPATLVNVNNQAYVIVESTGGVNNLNDRDTDSTTNEVLTVVEDYPTPQGGMEEFYKYIGSNMQYPAQARRLGVEGKVYIQFIVSKDGSIKDVKVIKGIGGGCDKEAARVIAESENWIPGKQKGIPVDVRMVMPISFALN